MERVLLLAFGLALEVQEEHRVERLPVVIPVEFPVPRDVEADAFLERGGGLFVDGFHLSGAGAAGDTDRHRMVAADIEGEARFTPEDDREEQGRLLLFLLLRPILSGTTLPRSILSRTVLSRSILFRAVLFSELLLLAGSISALGSRTGLAPRRARAILLDRDFAGEDDKLQERGSLELRLPVIFFGRRFGLRFRRRVSTRLFALLVLLVLVGLHVQDGEDGEGLVQVSLEVHLLEEAREFLHEVIVREGRKEVRDVILGGFRNGLVQGADQGDDIGITLIGLTEFHGRESDGIRRLEPVSGDLDVDMAVRLRGDLGSRGIAPARRARGEVLDIRDPLVRRIGIQAQGRRRFPGLFRGALSILEGRKLVQNLVQGILDHQADGLADLLLDLPDHGLQGFVAHFPPDLGGDFGRG